MNDAKRNRNLIILMCVLVLVGSIGCLVEMRAANLQKAELQQGLVGKMTESSVTGGRARGGSFDRPSAPSAPSDFGRSRPIPRDYGRDYDYYSPRPSYPRGGRVIVPVPAPYPNYAPTPSYYGTDGGAGISLIFLLLVLGFFVLPIILNFIKLKSVSSPNGYSSGSELTNDVVTVSQIQVALLSQARALQGELEKIAARSDLDTQAELNQMLQETALTLLRYPEYWSYAKVNSKTLPSREQAAQFFEQLSIQERTKYKTETFVNIGGQVHRQSVTLPQEGDDYYIVVTLLVGTADDKPIVGIVHSVDELRAALQRLASISNDYLLIYELVWSPQDASDSLSSDQLLASYPDLMLIG